MFFFFCVFGVSLFFDVIDGLCVRLILVSVTCEVHSLCSYFEMYAARCLHEFATIGKPRW